MGYFSGVFVKSDLEHVRARGELCPSAKVRHRPGCGWLALHGMDIEPIEDGCSIAQAEKVFARFAQASAELDRPVAVVCGHSVSDGTTLLLFEGGRCVRVLESSQDGYRVRGTTVWPWERELVEAWVQREYDDEMQLSSTDRRVVDEVKLHDGASIPRTTCSEFCKALGIDEVLSAGEVIEVRAKMGIVARLFGR